MGHGERRRELERQFPGWEIWYVPREADSATWCARPQMLIGAGSPEDLSAAIRAAHSQGIPGSLLLASPRGYPARVRRLRELEEPAGAARRRAKARERRRVPRRRRAFGLAWPGASVSGQLTATAPGELAARRRACRPGSPRAATVAGWELQGAARTRPSPAWPAQAGLGKCPGGGTP